MQATLPTKAEIDASVHYLNRAQLRELDWLLLNPKQQAHLKPSDDDYLFWYLRDCLHFDIARHAVCEEHTAPFQFISDLYFERVQRAVGLGPRGGGKTRLASLLWWIRACHEKIHIFHCGGVEEQAKRGYGYLREYVKLPQFAGLCNPRDSLMSETRWPSGAVLEIHAATMNQTSGAHPDLKVGDELEKWRYDVYQQFLGMGTGENCQTVFISTREKAFGLMQQVLDDAPERDIKVYSWCVWETKEPCVSNRSDEYKDWTKACKGNECLLWEPCQGRYWQSDGHRSTKNIADKYLLSSTAVWESQHLCVRPGSEGLCFPSLITEPGDSEHSNVTLEATYNDAYPIVCYCDDNIAAPRAILFTQEGFLNGIKRVWAFGEYFEPGRLQTESVRDVLLSLPKRPEYVVIPSEAVALRIAWQQEGIMTVSPKGYRRVEGVNVVNQFIRDVHGQRVFLLHPSCKNAIRSLRNHHRAEVAPGIYGDEPVKQADDHFADCICYGLFLRRWEQ